MGSASIYDGSALAAYQDVVVVLIQSSGISQVKRHKSPSTVRMTSNDLCSTTFDQIFATCELPILNQTHNDYTNIMYYN